MRLPRMTTRGWMIAIMVLSVLLTATGHWIASGGPVGFACGWCQTSHGGRTIVASSYNMLRNISLLADKDSVQLDMEGRNIVVRVGEVTIDDAAGCLIPTGCKQLQFMASGGVLRVSADGRTIQEIRR